MAPHDSDGEPQVEPQPSRNGTHLDAASAKSANESDIATSMLLTGDSLADILATRSAPTHDRSRFLKLFEELCRILAYMHGQQMVHGRLSPDKVKLDVLGRVHVVGWGKGISSEKGIAPPEPAAIDSPAFSAPEQARGEWSRLSPRTDVFSLGAILLEILIGRPPYEGKTSADLLSKARNADLGEAFARLDASGIDTSLILLVRRCLNAQPEERPADAGELLRLVSAYRDVLDDRARKAEAEVVVKSAVEAEQGKRKQLQLALILIVGMFVIWVGVFIWWQERQDNLRKMLSSDPAPVPKRPEIDPLAAQQKARERDEFLKQRRLQYERQKAEIIARLKNPPRPPSALGMPLAPPPREAGQPLPAIPDPDPE